VGLHRRQTVVPKSGDQFIGDPGAIMDGENVAVYAFNPGASPYPSDVVIRGLKITRYNPPFQSGAILAGGNSLHEGGHNWVIENNEIVENATGGIRLADGMQVRGNNIHHNHAIGITGIGDNVLIENNEIAFNNYLKEFAWGNEAGGTKFVYTNGLIVRNNYVHDNWGPGLWTDISNRNSLYEGNTVLDNAGPGIFHEISFAAVIRNNTIKRNGFDFAGWIWGGGIQVATSRDVEIYGNTLEDNKVGISVTQQNRGTDPLPPFATWVTANINVHDNNITQRVGWPAGAALDYGDHPAFYAGISFTNNDYFLLPSLQSTWSWWDAGGRSWADWRGFGHDLTGSLTTIP
jgi:parallel beta-helix repeat protein